MRERDEFLNSEKKRKLTLLTFTIHAMSEGGGEKSGMRERAKRGRSEKCSNDITKIAEEDAGSEAVRMMKVTIRDEERCLLSPCPGTNCCCSFLYSPCRYLFL